MPWYKIGRKQKQAIGELRIIRKINSKIYGPLHFSPKVRDEILKRCSNPCRWR